MKQFLIGICLWFLFLYLLFCPVTSLSVCIKVLALWSHSIVPSLLPVMILARLLISTNFLFLFLKPVSFFYQKLLGLSPAGTYALILGYLCGYPMGVKTISDLIGENMLSAKEGRYLACFINNVSPGFLITYICTSLLHAPFFIIPCLVIVYGASLSFGLLTGLSFKQTAFRSSSAFSNTNSSFFQTSKKNVPSFLSFFDQTLEESILLILKIGGYMLIFSLISSAICSPSFIPYSVKAICCSILEISYGADMLSKLSVPAFWKCLFLMVSLSFGGLCSTFQSTSFLKKIGVPLKKYIKIKAMTSVIALIYYLIYTHSIWISYFLK